MNLQELDNHSAADVKAKRVECIAACKEADHAALAERYVSTLVDAKARDEKLAEQGRTIATLTDALDAAKATIKQHEAAVAAAADNFDKEHAAHVAACEQHARDLAANKETNDNLKTALAAETARADRNATLAARSEGAINAIAKTANDIIAARQVETTNEGE